VKQWVASIGLDPHQYGTHSLRRTKAVLIYKKTGNLRAVQLLLGHAKLDYLPKYIGSKVLCGTLVLKWVMPCESLSRSNYKEHPAAAHLSTATPMPVRGTEKPRTRLN
jgi:hypothetical protein